MKLHTIHALPLLLLAGCSSLVSQKQGNTALDGLVYHLPKRDIVVSVTRAADKTATVSIEAGPAYADLKRSYVLQYQPNWLGKNKLDIQVSPAGLLQTAKSTTTSKATEALTGLAQSAAAAAAKKAGAPAKAGLEATGVDCSATGVYVFVISAAGADTDSAEGFCSGMTLTVKRLDWTDKDMTDTPEPLAESGAGIYYRRNLPYQVMVGGAGVRAAAVVLSPSLSPTYYLPTARTLFSSNDAQFGFTDGVPATYVQDTDPELVEFLSLPAKVLNSYFDALSATFGKSTKARQDEATALAQSTTLELAKLKHAACMKAIDGKDKDMVAQLKCGE